MADLWCKFFDSTPSHEGIIFFFFSWNKKIVQKLASPRLL